MPRLFKKKRLTAKAKDFIIPQMEEKLAVLQQWHKAHTDGILKKKTESQVEQAFNQSVFEQVLGYTPMPADEYTYEPKADTEATAQKPDAVLAHFTKDKAPNRVGAVVEIKDVNVPLDRPQKRANSETPIQQGFRYKTQYKQCDFVIVTNFQEVRLFKDNQLDYEQWTLAGLIDPKDDHINFRTFYYLLCADNLLSKRGKSKTESLLSEIRIEQDAITKKFYGEYKQLRQDLITNILKNNQSEETGFHSLAVEKSQKIIDRIVFVAFCEDLDLLPEHTLMTVIKHAQNSFSGVWDMLKGFFNAVDTGSVKLGIPDGFNGELFKPDNELNNLKIDDEICERFLQIGAYDFSEDLSVNILGHIFEQSISDLEELKASAEGEEADKKKSKRKKDGIFYTPEYIVDYIVKNSVGAYLKEKETEILAQHGVKEDLQDKNYEKRLKAAYTDYRDVLQNIKVLDPACGSGAFLVNVFDFLLAENQRVGEILGDLFNNDSYFRSILQNNIYGVDLNPESVEITKLSLWLKTAEKGKKLTTLKNNIKCGNSLIDDPEVAGKRAFKWEEEFADIMQAGGFDVVVGNPPWVFARGNNFTQDVKDYYYEKYPLANYQLNTYLLFFDRGYSILKADGQFSFIVPNTCLTIDSFEPFRKFLLNDVGQLNVVNIFGQVFEGASVDSCIISFKKSSKNKVKLSEMHDGVLNEVGSFAVAELAQGKHIINIAMMKNPEVVKLMEKIDKLSKPLEKISTIKSGLVAYEIGKGSPKQTREMKDERVYHFTSKNDENCYPYLDGRDVCRYAISWGGKWIKYGNHLAAPRQIELFTQPRILVRQIPNKPPYCIHACFTNDDLVNDRNSNNIIGFEDEPYYLLGVINSRLTSFWFINKFDKLQRGVFPQFKVKELAMFPVPKADNAQKNQISDMVQTAMQQHTDLHAKIDRFQKLVMAEYGIEKWGRKLNEWWTMDFADFTKTLKLTKLSLAEKDDLMTLYEKYKAELSSLTTKIAKTDRVIDDMVFDLYGLSDEEREIILKK